MAKKYILTVGAEVAAPPEIRGLVEKFAEHRETYRRTGYNETQLRQDFLDPLFVALGWDVYNRQGFAEAYRDVILEQGLKVEQSVRAPDYCFRIGGTAKFFVCELERQRKPCPPNSLWEVAKGRAGGP